jgi:hypothetical protein
MQLITIEDERETPRKEVVRLIRMRLKMSEAKLKSLNLEISESRYSFEKGHLL